MMIDNTMIIERVCQNCLGKQIIIEPHCALCGHRIDDFDSWWYSDEDVMPCGHSARDHFIESVSCPTCQGSGQIEQSISMSAWKINQRNKILKIIFLIFLASLPILAILLAIYREPGYICGAWWYGLLLSPLIYQFLV